MAKGQVHSRGPKFNPDKYTDEQRALFARYREHRLVLRPSGCVGHSPCWVEDGPPCYSKSIHDGSCLGCGQSIVSDPAFVR